MRRSVSVSRLVFSVVLAGLSLQLATERTARADEPAQPLSPLKRLDLQAGDCIVFLGDSITHQCLYTQYVEDFFYTRYPTMRLKFHNAGVGGAKAWDALERFERDVKQYQPKYVTVLLGMNDGRYTPFDEEIFQTYRRDMTALIERIADSGATPVLMTPTMFDARAARTGRRKRDPDTTQLYNGVLAYYGCWLRDVAVESGYGFVDMYGPLNNLTLAQRKIDPSFTMIRDAVHPDPPGQLVMAYALLDDLGLRSPLSNIRIVRDAKGKPTARATGGKVSDLKVGEGEVAFTWLAKGLPFVLPEEATPGAKMLRLGHRMSREALEVHGLPAGQYELQIDDKPVGVYTAVALARHVELQENSATPQYQQALQVANLNKQRNAGPVRSLRNEWRNFQAVRRLQAQAMDLPENASLQEKIRKLEAKLSGVEQRISEHEAAALKLEDEIFQINQPKPRRYVLKRVKPANVQGVLMLNGLPIANSKVTFSRAGWSTETTTDKDGRYSLRAPEGTYNVRIHGFEAESDAGKHGASNAAKQERKTPGDRVAVPQAFATPSVLRVEVRQGVRNELQLELTDD